MKLRRRLFPLLAVFSLCMALSATGCGPRMARHVARAALVTGAVVRTAAAVGAAAHRAHHRAHYHHHNCGCYREYRHGHWTYYYEGGWEYYDPHHRVWIRHR